MRSINIYKIDASYSGQISAILNQSPSEYTKYFDPFHFDLSSVKSIIEKTRKDVFFGIFVDQIIVGFYMLRGWDDGFEAPAYGVFISPENSKLGFGKLSLNHAISFCRVNKIKKIMLKVHPENLKAKQMYEAFGFKMEGIDRKNNNLIYFKEL